MTTTLIAEQDEAIEAIRRIGSFQPRVGLILGSGLGALADHIQDATRIPYQDIPHFPRSHVAGHAGNLVFGTIANQPVVAMQGRAHLYEGWSGSQATFPLRVMHALGIELLIVSNASGGINPRFQSGEIVLIDSHIDMMYTHGISCDEARSGAAAEDVPNRTRGGYSKHWMTRVQELALELGFLVPRGTYLATLGPNYETRAEYRAFAKLGADMVGMSTVHEVNVAAQLGLPVIAFSIVTNVAKPDAPTVTDHQEVLDWSKKAQDRMIPLVARIVGNLV